MINRSRPQIFSILILVSLLAGWTKYEISAHVFDRNNGYELHVPAGKLFVTTPEDGFIQTADTWIDIYLSMTAKLSNSEAGAKLTDVLNMANAKLLPWEQ